MKFAYNPKPEKSVKVYGRALRISTKNSVIVCRALSGMKLDKGRMFLANLLTQYESLNGKYYTKIARDFSKLLLNAAGNAEFKGLDPNRLFIHISAHKGFSFRRPRRFKMRGERRKITNIQLVLEQR